MVLFTRILGWVSKTFCLLLLCHVVNLILHYETQHFTTRLPFLNSCLLFPPISISNSLSPPECLILSSRTDLAAIVKQQHQAAAMQQQQVAFSYNWQNQQPPTSCSKKGQTDRLFVCSLQFTLLQWKLINKRFFLFFCNTQSTPLKAIFINSLKLHK